MKENIHKTICPYCGVGCGVLIKKNKDSITEIIGDPNYPVNKGMLCSKGMMLHHVFNEKRDRLLYPMMRWSKNSQRERVSWDIVLFRIASIIKAVIEKFGPEAIGFYVSGQILTEEYYLINKIAKGFIGTPNIDTNSRLCMSSTVAAFKKVFGADTVPISYDDIEHSDVILIAGANPAYNHPILFRRIEKHKELNPNTKIIVVDPRKTDTSNFSDLHLQIISGTDVTLFLGIAKGLIENNYIDYEFIQNHISGYDNFLNSIKDLSYENVCKTCSISLEDLFTTIHWIGKAKGFLTFWAMGLNQSINGVDKNIALISLNLITGKIGKPGCGTFSLTGQPNAMGGREVGGFSNALVAHRELTNPEHRNEIAKFWKTDKIPDHNGLTILEMIESILEGKLKVLWVICTNPLISLPNQDKVQKALKRIPFLIVQEISHYSETLEYADAILPAAGWLEKEGTMTNSERRIAYLPRLFNPPGEALPDMEIFLRFAKMMGFSEFDYKTAEEIYKEYIQLTRNTEIDISGLNYTRLKEYSYQWPVLFETHNGTKRLFTDFKFYTNDGKAKLYYLQEIEREQESEYDFILLNGRIRDQWHTMTKTGKCGRLLEHQNQPFAEISPEDAKCLNLNPEDIVEITSSYGKARYIIKINPNLKAKTIFVPMHWGKNFYTEFVKVNYLTSFLRDPISKQPDFKYTKVRINKFRNSIKKIAIIGAGTATRKFIESYRKRNSETEIIAITKEKDIFYNRVLLPNYIAGDKSLDSLFFYPNKEEIQKLKIDIISGKEVIRILPNKNIILLDDLKEINYDVLIIATGSQPKKEKKDSSNINNLLCLRTIEDANRILETCKKRCIIIGGGLLGIELANALIKRNIEVTIIHRSSTLMNKQIDLFSSNLLKKQLEEKGIKVYLNQSITEYRIKSNNIFCVELASGEILDCDAVIYTIGTEANLYLAKAANIRYNQGIVVDSYLKTNFENIYAIGEIAEFQGIRYGTTYSVEEQANILAEHLNGNPCAIYRGSLHINILKTDSLPIASVTSSLFPRILTYKGQNQEEIIFINENQKKYKKIILENNRIVSAILVGDIANFATISSYIEKKLEINSNIEEMLFSHKIKVELKGNLVCSCYRVGEKNIEEVLNQNKSLQVQPEELFRLVLNETLAGTGCGSCKIEIRNIIQKKLKLQEEMYATIHN